MTIIWSIAVSAMTRRSGDHPGVLSIKVYGSSGSSIPNPVGDFVQASLPQYIIDTLTAASFSRLPPSSSNRGPSQSVAATWLAWQDRVG